MFFPNFAMHVPVPCPTAWGVVRPREALVNCGGEGGVWEVRLKRQNEEP